MQKVLPLGSIVYLKNNKEKVMIISRGAVYEDEAYFDYIGCLAPHGFDGDKTLFFNHEKIDEILFIGFEYPEEKRLAKLYLDWKASTDIPQGKNEGEKLWD